MEKDYRQMQLASAKKRVENRRRRELDQALDLIKARKTDLTEKQRAELAILCATVFAPGTGDSR